MSDLALTLALAAAAGAVLSAAAVRLRIPVIALLLLGGIALGPEGVGLIHPEALGEGLKIIVGMAVAVVLFEGALTLDVSGAKSVSKVIIRLLSLGVLITWWGTAAVVYLLFDFPPAVAILSGSLIIVTGPTVIAPLLRRIDVAEHLKQILYWEAVLVDAIGVFIAVLCLEWLSPDLSATGLHPLLRFGVRLAVGGGIGLFSGWLLAVVIERRMVSKEQLNIFVLAFAILTYAGSEVLLHESGVLSVIVAGFVVGRRVPSTELASIRRFKLELAELGIGTLFVLLASTLQLSSLLMYGWSLPCALVLVLLVLRPLAVLLATHGADLRWRERFFLSWIAPRGIVAAFLASLFASVLSRHDGAGDGAQFVFTFTFAVIASTVILQGLSAPWVAKLLRVAEEPRRAWLLAGEPAITTPLGEVLRSVGVQAVELVHHTRRAPLDATYLTGDLFDVALTDDQRLVDVGALMVVSNNAYFNQMAVDHWQPRVGQRRCYVWGPLPGAFGDAISWPQAEDPRGVVRGLEREEWVFGAVPLTGQRRMDASQRPLFWIQGQEAVIALTDAPPPDAQVAVVLRRRVPGLAALVQGATVIDHHPDYETVLSSLCVIAASALGTDDPVTLRNHVTAHHGVAPTCLGGGIAIFHAYEAQGIVAQTAAFVAAVRGGVRSRGPAGSPSAAVPPDGVPVRLVFLVLSPREHAESHLTALTVLAQLGSDQRVVRLLGEQPSDEALRRHIRQLA